MIEKVFEQGSKFNIVKVLQYYSGELIGISEVFYYMYYRVVGEVFFSGFEYINGVIDNQVC